MHYKILFYALIITLTLSNCTNLRNDSAKPKQEPKTKASRAIHLKKLNTEVKKLNSHDKRLIYKSIKNEIKIDKQRGDADYCYGYYYDAIKAYELVNFYEDSNTIPLEKINEMKIAAQQRAAYHYKNAKKYLKTNKKRALSELNMVLMNNPNYKNSKNLYNTIANQRDIQIFLNKMENSLETQLVNMHDGNFEELKAVRKKLQKLEKYDYKNRAIEKARKILKKQEKILTKTALQLYKENKLSQAKKEFSKILSIYPHNEKAKIYLQMILFKQNKKRNLDMAHLALKQKNYKKATYYAENILKIDPQSKEAKEIIIQAEKEAQKTLYFYREKGKQLYNNKNLDGAKSYFEKALKIDKNDNTSLIYYKKIQRQLQTIKSLR